MDNHAELKLSRQEKWTEDLLWQASRGHTLGRIHCRCEGHYHTLWGALRASEAVNSLQFEEENFSPVISPLVTDESRLLIAGSADPGILCTLGRIAGPRNPSFTVIDKCPAPLALIKEFAATKGFSCDTVQADILELDGHKLWDFIFVHYTHAFVESSYHKQFFGALARSLAPGGTLACFTKTNTKTVGMASQNYDRVWFTQSYKAIRESELSSFWSNEELDELLRAYVAAGAVRRRNFLTVEDIAKGLAATGLQVSVEHFTQEKGRSEENVLRYASYGSSPVILATKSS